jgi:hypothetical protein
MMMNNFLTKAGLTLSLALSLGAATAIAKPKKADPCADQVKALTAAKHMPHKTADERKARQAAILDAQAKLKQCRDSNKPPKKS